MKRRPDDQRDRTGTSPHQLAVGRCVDHDKFVFISRGLAKVAARHMKQKDGGHMAVFRCDVVEQWWHIGHLAEPVIRGSVDRSTLYGEGCRVLARDFGEVLDGDAA